MFDPDDLDARDPRAIARLLPLVRQINRHYFRLEISGLENVPKKRAMLIANHNSGILGPDLFGTLGSLWEHLGPHAPLYALAHDFVMRQLTVVGERIQKYGGIRAAPGNARRVLEHGGLVLVYPGGDLEAYRHWTKRDRIVLGERTGFVKVAQAAQAAMVPVVAQGAHRSAFIFAEGRRIADRFELKRRARVTRFPLALSLPWGLTPGPWLPYLPLPFKVKIRVLPPVFAEPRDDPARVQRTIARQMQDALDDLAR